MNMEIKELNQVRARFKELGLTEEVFIREASFAIQQIKKSSTLSQCTRDSLIDAVINVGNLGLTLNPVSKECYLIPRKDGGEWVAHLEPSYMGLIKLMVQDGCITSLVSHVVYEQDEFELSLADNKAPVVHKPSIGVDRGKMVGVYALATLHNGDRQVEFIHVDHIKKIMDRSESYKYYVRMKKQGKKVSCVWVTDFEAMARKTPIKSIYKYLPKKSKLVDLAIGLDNQDFQITSRQEEFIVSLMGSATISDHEKNAIDMELSMMSMERANEVIDYLKQNQLEVGSQANPRAKELNQFIKEKIEYDDYKESKTLFDKEP